MTEISPRPVPDVVIYTDGGADPNPGPGGWGAVLLHPPSGRSEELSGGEAHSTNNRMELTAAIHALEALQRRCQVELHTDSQYLRRGITEWLPGWIARGWRRKDGELQNEDLWRRLAAAAERHDIRWRWVKGHAGQVHNERADRLAAAAIRKQRLAARGVGTMEATAASGAMGAAGALPQGGGSPAPPEAEVYLRVSRSREGAGWAAIIRRQGAESVLSGGLPAGAAATANALDLLAALAALQALPAGVSVAVHTASDYLRHGASRWLPGWRRRGWKTQEGGAVQNRELWQRLEAAMAARELRWPEVKDREVEELERLAPLARAAARGDRDSPPPGGGGGGG
jgi:ribonuclease HI